MPEGDEIVFIEYNNYIGYDKPSKQGVCGKPCWIFDESDIIYICSYKEYHEAKKTVAVKRKGSTESNSKIKHRMTSAKVNAQTLQLDEVDTIYHKLTLYD